MRVQQMSAHERKNQYTVLKGNLGIYILKRKYKQKLTDERLPTQHCFLIGCFKVIVDSLVIVGSNTGRCPCILHPIFPTETSYRIRGQHHRQAVDSDAVKTEDISIAWVPHDALLSPHLLPPTPAASAPGSHRSALHFYNIVIAANMGTFQPQLLSPLLLGLQ